MIAVTTTFDYVPAGEGRAHVEAAAQRVVARVTVLVGVDAKRYAPKDTGELIESIEAVPKLGVVYVRADHWAAQEYGAQPHEIPNAFGRGITVEHPGNGAQPYMRPALYTKRDLS